MNNPHYDVAIIGSGIAGSALGAILARHGQRVVIFEAKAHPRFAIGESLILETSEIMRALAAFYDVPELAYFSTENFLPFAGTTHGIKRHFGFLHHETGRPHDPGTPCRR
jgi:tetracycline 7-halogenase / FADH2 O2-dependent halogenase